MLELDGVEKRVGDAVHVADVSLRLQPGTLNVLVGPTLSGKTTLMRLMAGLDRPTAGRVLEDGRDVTGVRVQNRAVAMVYQQFINYPALTVYENIASPMRVAGRPRAEIDATVRRVAELLRLTPYLERLPLQLSGGQQQRTALARALAKDAKLVLLDEPLANLDYKLREELRAELPKIFGASGAIFVYATAEPEEALLLGGNVAVLEAGRVVEFGPTLAVYRGPRSLAAARGLSDPPLNVVAARKERGTFFADGAAIPVAAGFAAMPDGPCFVAIRAHHLTLAPAHAATLTGVVTGTEITGSETFVRVRAASDLIVVAPGVHTLELGQEIGVDVAGARAMVFDADGARVVPAPAPAPAPMAA